MSLLRPSRQIPAPPPPGEVDHDDAHARAEAAAADGWSFTARAREAMTSMHLSVADVAAVLAAPASVRPSVRESRWVATRAGLMVVHDRAGRCVVSVVREHGGAS